MDGCRGQRVAKVWKYWQEGAAQRQPGARSATGGQLKWRGSAGGRLGGRLPHHAALGGWDVLLLLAHGVLGALALLGFGAAHVARAHVALVGSRQGRGRWIRFSGLCRAMEGALQGRRQGNRGSAGLQNAVDECLQNRTYKGLVIGPEDAVTAAAHHTRRCQAPATAGIQADRAAMTTGRP